MNVDEVLAGLTLEEKTSLTAGADFWSTVAIERVGIPSVRVTDGPSGARGAHIPGVGGVPSVCIPCGSAMGATWNPALTEQIGALVGREARDRGCRVLLAPTVNLHRSPLAGRNFECYSEDPLLSGVLAAAFVRGVQSREVIATVKHFVGNEAEFERGSISSVIDERALRELYLVPFEHAVRDGGALAVMTSYNRVNGKWNTERPELLLDLLRGEWGFGGLVMTDWFGVVDTVVSARAGLDLEMPGPGRAFGPALLAAVKAGDVDESSVDDMVRRLLSTFDRFGILDAPVAPVAPAGDLTEDRALVRRAAIESTVLLRNDGVLPLDATAGVVRRVAVVGPNANAPRIMGGGSSQVLPHPVETPLAALRVALGDGVDVVHERGCVIDRSARPIGARGLVAPDGFDVEVVDGEGRSVARQSLPDTKFLFFEPPDAAITKGEAWSLRVTGTVVPEETGRYDLSLAQAGATRVSIGGAVVLDGVADPPPPGGSEFFGLASKELTGGVDLVAGRPVDVVVEFFAPAGGFAFGARVGFRLPEPADLMERAVAAVRDADVTVVVVGTSEEWESEGRDRTSFSLPGRQDELVRRVAGACARTVVVVNAGAPVDLPWVDDVGAVLQCWFGGEEMGPALADVLVGAAEPGGRLATTIPVRIEHNPSYDNFPGENGELRYGEGLFMGYRGYDHRCLPVRFPFGHGLGYTTFAIGAPSVEAMPASGAVAFEVRVPLTNTGGRRGSEVVQCYVAPVGDTRLARPPKELKAFAKVELDPGESTVVSLTLDERAFAYWDPGQSDWEAIQPRRAQLTAVEAGITQDRRAPGWQVDPGTYRLLVGRSSADLPHAVDVVIRGS
ncbi:MAG TPA: glycoside hydrolase family 3 C-terminal domain-containing protein [Acidimicrobiales bacterium]|nr:glycoside hydrolase family 3 C-terminal domain-containing protein [Acidimicrobiales bacterium]